MPLKCFSIVLTKIKPTKNLSWKGISAMAYRKSSQCEVIQQK